MKKIIAALLVLVFVSMMPVVSHAGTDFRKEAFVRLNGVDGLCRDSAHTHWIDALEYGLNYAPDGETVTGITFTHLIEPATTKIIECYMNGVWIRSAEMEVCQYYAGRQYVVQKVEMGYLRIAGTEVILLEDGRVAETVTLITDEITVTESPLVIGPEGVPVWG